MALCGATTAVAVACGPQIVLQDIFTAGPTFAFALVASCGFVQFYNWCEDYATSFAIRCQTGSGWPAPGTAGNSVHKLSNVRQLPPTDPLPSINERPPGTTPLLPSPLPPLPSPVPALFCLAVCFGLARLVHLLWFGSFALVIGFGFGSFALVLGLGFGSFALVLGFVWCLLLGWFGWWVPGWLLGSWLVGT